LNVTEHPTAHWAAQQIVDAFPDDSAPAYILRDRDAVYGDAFRQRVMGMGIAEVLAAPHSPWQKIPSGATHLSLDKDAPNGRPIEPPDLGAIISIPDVGGLHHRYVRRSA
jgi:putative transposase